MWDPGWDSIFSESEWGRYPPEEVIRAVSRATREVADRQSFRVLEVGCGAGANLWFVAREGFDAYGIDGSQVAISQALSRLESEGLTAKIRLGDAMSLPYDTGYFDMVLDIECIYANTMADSRVIVAEIFRVLKPNGYFLTKTFMTGTYGDGINPTLTGEPNTYVEMTEGACRHGYGVVRLSSREDILDLHSAFEVLSLDYVIRSERSGGYEVKEWVGLFRKSVPSEE